jgi:hypothetical protein
MEPRVLRLSAQVFYAGSCGFDNYDLALCFNDLRKYLCAVLLLISRLCNIRGLIVHLLVML